MGKEIFYKGVYYPYPSGKWKWELFWDFILFLSEWLRLRKQTTIKRVTDVGKWEQSCTTGGNNPEIDLPYDPTLSVLNMYL